jgi:hypothetical protein
MDKVMLLHKSGKVEESLQLALKIVKSNPDNQVLLSRVALFIIQNNHYHIFGEAVKMLKTIIGHFHDDINVQNAFSYACWVTGDKIGCFQGALRVVALNYKTEQGYVRLGMFLLTEKRYTEAFLALSSGLQNSENKATIQFWFDLARHLMQGKDIVKFNVDGTDFSFGLDCFNGQAMETAAHHVHGTFTEFEELRFLKKELVQCTNIVEVGILVGNHLIYFMKMLRPVKIFAFDADARSINETKRNVELNRSDDLKTEVILYNKAVGDHNGIIRMLDRDVEVVTLSDAIVEPVDFLKIDVDGMEMEVIHGARDLIRKSRPKIMIEVENRCRDRFLEYMGGLDYVVKKQFSRGDHSNVFLIPRLC